MKGTLGGLTTILLSGSAHPIGIDHLYDVIVVGGIAIMNLEAGCQKAIVKKISVILPVYNEAEVIEKFSDALFDTLTCLTDKYCFEVIFCVEKCSDGTAEIVKEICRNRKEAIYLGMARRFGHQNMLIAGMDRSSGDAVIMMDCDLEHPPSLIPILLEKFEEGYDVVHTKRRYNDNVSWLRRMPSDIYWLPCCFQMKSFWAGLRRFP